MKKNVKKYGLMIIAAVLLVAMAFAGAASAVSVDIGSAEEWNAFAGDTANYTKDINITSSFSFDGGTPVILGNSNNGYSGNISGNGYTISNFVINKPSDIGIGLIGYYKGTCIKNLTLRNFSVSGSRYVGGLVGYASSPSIEKHIENVRIEYGAVFGGSDSVGGMVGEADNVSLKNCTVENCVIVSEEAEDSGAGGLVGTLSLGSFDRCRVVNSSVSGNFDAGGLVGCAKSASDSPIINGSRVTNCIVSAGGNEAGGLVGQEWDSTQFRIAGCVVEDCTIVSRDAAKVGGLVGGARSANCVFNAGNWVNESAVRGKNSGGYDYVGEVVGCDVSSKRDIADYSSTGTVRSEGSIWLNNDSNANYPKIYIAKSTDPGKQGPELPDYFNDTTADEVPYGAKLVTQLTGYGPNGQYAALGYVYEPSTPYDIYITNKTNTYQLTSVLTKVYGDDGNGYANLTEVDTATGTYTLELNGFKASNMSGNVPIISASVPNLTIVLDGESKLTGSFEDSWGGVLTVNGNLTIEGDSSSKLLVDNTNSSSSYLHISISVDDDLTINGAKVTATANNTSSVAYSIYAGNDISIGQNSVVEATAASSSFAYSIYADNDISIGQNSVVDATATSTSYDAYSIYAHNDIKIESASKVNAKAQGEDNTHALHAWGGNISLGQNSVVEATATSTSSFAYSIYAADAIKIESAKKVNATAESLGGVNKHAYGLYVHGGTITITDSQDVTATATAPYAYSIMAAEFYHSNTYDFVIANSKVTAKADGKYNAFALSCLDGSITITGDKTVIDANATCTGQAGSGAGAILAYEDITITSAERIKAIGTNSSFVYNGSGSGSLNIDELADYKFSNASVNGAEPKLYSTFVNSSNWYDSGTDIVSNFTAVLIEKKATTPSSSSKHSGSTVILPNTVDIPDAVDLLDTADAADTSANLYTVNFSMNGHGIQVINQSVSFGNTADEPSPVPTADGYTFTGWYTDKGLVSKYAFSTPVTDDIELYAGWTAKTPTSKSPAPVVGLIAGLGAAALVLGRLRH